jgi:dTDP-glucose 4,6-dehydratase
MRRFLIIGAAGTVGRNLTRYLEGKKEVYRGVDFVYRDHRFIDILNAESVAWQFNNFHPTHVIHLAAAVGRVFNSLDHHNSINVNVLGTFNVIRESIEYKAKFTYVGTSESYGSRFKTSPNYPADEFAVPMDFPVFKGIYGLTKLVGEKLVGFYTVNSHLCSSVVRLFMCYAADGSVANDQTAISRMFRSAMANEPIEVHKDTSRSWCYVDDIVQGIYLAAQKGYRLYNIGKPDETIASLALAQKIIHLTGSKSKIREIEPPPDIYRHKNFNIKLAQEELGYEPTIGLDEGLGRVWEWLNK